MIVTLYYMHIDVNMGGDDEEVAAPESNDDKDEQDYEDHLLDLAQRGL